MLSKSFLKTIKNHTHENNNLNFSKYYFCKTPKITTGEKVKFFFNDTKEKKITEVEGFVGESVVDISKRYEQSIEAACEQSLSCSTCHIILDEETYNSLEKPREDEEDLLDLTHGLTNTSRLGCQIKISKLLEGKTLIIPSESKDSGSNLTNSNMDNGSKI